MTGVAEFDRSFEAQQIMRTPKRDTTTITDVLRRWAAGHDTALIASSTGLPQSDVCRIIAADQDYRHAERAARAEAVIAETVQARSGRLHRV